MIPIYADLSVPAKERIASAAFLCFVKSGIYATVREIAAVAQSNEETVIKHYKSHSRLVETHVLDLIKQSEAIWKEYEAEYPDDPEALLRSWIDGIEVSVGDPSSAMGQLLLASAQLTRWTASPLLKHIKRVRAGELAKIELLCRKAGFDEPSSLAQKLMLLVDGAWSNGNCFGYDGPQSHLSEAAADLMATHRGGGKLLSPPN